MTHGNPLAYAFVNAFAAGFVDYLSFDKSGVDSVNPNAIGRRFLRCAFGHAEYRQLAGNVGKGATCAARPDDGRDVDDRA